MNTNAHTPGPWHVEKPTTERKKGTFATLLTGVGGRGFPTCEFEITSENYKNSDVEANAVLIASAPELLDAAKWASTILSGYLSANSQDERNYMWKDLQHAGKTLDAAIDKATAE